MTIRKAVITVADIRDMLNLGIVRPETQLMVPTSWNPVAVRSLTCNDPAGGDFLYLEAPVESGLVSCGHHGAPMRGEVAGAVGDRLALAVDQAHAEYGQGVRGHGEGDRSI